MVSEKAASAARYKERTGNEWPYIESDIKEIAEAPEKRFVDFSLLVPEPESIFRGGCNMQHPHVDENGVVYEHCWSDWNRNHWGTKWNGYDSNWEPVEGDLCKLEFDTAWSHPFPVIEALIAKFPDEVIRVWWADEDLGQNVGYYVYDPAHAEDGDFEMRDLSGTDEGMELACQMKRGMSHAEVQAEWEADEIDWAQKHAHAERVAKERSIERNDAFTAIRDESLALPDDIATQITTKEQAEAYWETQTADA